MKTLYVLISLLIYFVPQQQPQVITFHAPGMFPEGIAWDAGSGNFFVSSVTDGTIGKVSTDGKYSIFFTDSSLKSTFGMKVDNQKKILWVCSGDPNYSRRSRPETFKKTAHVLGIDISTGKLKYDIELANDNEKHFPNDLCVDQVGNVFITDSYSPLIYKVDSAGKSTVAIQNDMLGGMDVALNGIVIHPGGYILVAHNSNGSLYKIDLKQQKVMRVQIDQFFPGADGLIMDTAGNLYLIQNKGVDKVFKITSADNWVTAKVAASTPNEARFRNPTTSTWKEGKLMILNARLNEINDRSKKPSYEFSIQEAVFEQ